MFRVNLHGMAVECDTAVEVSELAYTLTKMASLTAKPVREDNGEGVTADQVRRRRVSGALLAKVMGLASAQRRKLGAPAICAAFVGMLMEAKGDPIPASVLKKKLGLRALGGTFRTMQAMCTQGLGKPYQEYLVRSGTKGKSMWSARPEARELLAYLLSQISEEA